MPAIPDALRTAAQNIQLIVFDVDGVLTDGRLYYLNDGSELKAFDSQDGHGIKMLQKSGVKTAIITGRTSNIVAERAANLGIEHLQQGREDKLVVLESLLQELNINAANTAFVGDDLPDLAAIRHVGLGIAVANAHRFVAEHADWQTTASGGRGAVREICDFIMDSQGTLDDANRSYL